MSQSAETKTALARHQRLLYCRRLIRHGTRASFARVPRWYRLLLVRSRGPRPKRLTTPGDTQHIRILPALKAVMILIGALLFASPATAAPVAPQSTASQSTASQSTAAVVCAKNTAAGTLVAKGNGRGLVLTSPRVLDGQSQVFVGIAGHVYGANVLAVDRELEAAMLEIAEPTAEPHTIQLCSLRDGRRCPLLQRFVDRFRHRCQPGYACQPGYTLSPAVPLQQAAPPAQFQPQRDNRTPVNAAGQECPAGVCPLPNATQPALAPWLAERANLEQSHAAAMRAKAAELDQLQRTLAAERANTERALAAQKAHSNGAGAPAADPSHSGSVAGAPTNEPAAAGWLSSLGSLLGLSAEVAASVALGIGGPSSLAVGAWLLHRAWQKWRGKSSPATGSTPATGMNHELPATPMAIVTEAMRHQNHFSFVPTDKYDRVWSTAVQRLSERQPAYAKVLEMLVSVKDQLLKGEPTDGATK